MCMRKLQKKMPRVRRKLPRESCERLFIAMVKLFSKKDKDFILNGDGLEKISDLFGVPDCCDFIRDKVRRSLNGRKSNFNYRRA